MPQDDWLRARKRTETRDAGFWTRVTAETLDDEDYLMGVDPSAVADGSSTINH